MQKFLIDLYLSMLNIQGTALFAGILLIFIILSMMINKKREIKIK